MARAIGSGFYYGWVVVGACFIITGISYGIQYSFGVFFKPILEEFGWTRAMMSGVVSVYMIVHGGSAIVMGGLTDKYGPRAVVAIGGFLMGLSLIITSRVEYVWEFYLSYGVLFGIGMGIAYVPLQSTVSRWFVAQRGLAMGIVAAGSGIGTLIFTPLSAYLIALWHWRNSYTVFGILIGIVVICLATLLRHSPQEADIVPGRCLELGKGDENIKKNIDTEEDGLTLRQAVATKPFWMLLISFGLLGAPLGMVMVHLVPYSTDIGIDKTIAAVFLGLIGGSSVLGRLIMGKLGDKVGGRNALLICIVLQLSCMLWLQVARSPWMIYLFAVVFGFSYGGWVPLLALMASEFFGLCSMGMITGVLVLSVTIGGAIGPTLAGYMYDLRSSYETAFIGGAIITMIAFFITLFMSSPVKKMTAE
jgi:MFS family permease